MHILLFSNQPVFAGKYQTDALLEMDNKTEKNTNGVITSASSLLIILRQQKQKEHTYHSPGRTKRIMVQGRKLWQKSR